MISVFVLLNMLLDGTSSISQNSTFSDGKPKLSFNFKTNTNTSDLRERNTARLKNNNNSFIPVVYVFFVNNPDDILVPAYSWRTMTVTASHGNHVTLITSPRVELPPEAQSYGIRLYDISRLETEKLHLFRKRYKPWGIQEPWERQNTERFFVLARYMEIEGLPLVFYADSDVVLLVPVSTGLWGDHTRKCDSVLSLQHNGPIMKWGTGDWVAWAGSSVLSQTILKDFTNFAVAIYQDEFIKWLEIKHRNWPYVCDMSLWYLFVGTSDKKISKDWEWPNPNLPNTSQHHFCDILDFGFAHVGGYTKDENSGKIIPTHKSIHFQGGRKQDAFLMSPEVIFPAIRIRPK